MTTAGAPRPSHLRGSRRAEADTGRRAEAPADDEEDEQQQAAASEEAPDDDNAEDENPEPGDDEEDDDAAPTAKAVAGERKRIAAILRAPAAEGRTALAQTLALETDLPAAQAIAVLQAAPAAANTGGGLSEAMRRLGPTPVGPGGQAAGSDAEAIARRIAAL